MINVLDLSKNFDERMLLDNVSISINRGEKIGLTGPNGTGKTTLFSLILGRMEPNAGQVQVQRNLNIGYLPQEAHFDSQRTVIEEMTSGDDRIIALKKEKAELEEANKADAQRYGDVTHELEQLGIYDLEHRAEKILMGLGFKTGDFHRPIKELSGGWQMRVLLAKLLTYQYDVLLLDEPTNYLDLDATLWLKGYLAGYEGTLVIISHDKVFLNDITNYTIVLEAGQMTKVKGNYEQYELSKAERFRSLEKRKKVVDKKREQLERFAERFHAQPNKAAAVRNKRKMIERLEEIELPHERVSIEGFEFPLTVQSGYNVMTLENLRKSYANKEVYKDLNFEIARGQKVCLVGPNGAGKSTLMRTIATLQDPDSGSIRFNGVDVVRDKEGLRRQLGYLPQDFGVYPKVSAIELLNHFAVLKGLSSRGEREEMVAALLHQCNLWDARKRSVASFSGGMRQRFGIAQALLGAPRLVIVDEPTAGLDPDERNRFLNLLARIGENVVIILSTHIVQDVTDLCPRMAMIVRGNVLVQGEPQVAINTLKGQVWSRSVSEAALPVFARDFALLSTRLVGGKPQIKVFSDHQPDDGFVNVEPDLEDVYFLQLRSAQMPKTTA